MVLLANCYFSILAYIDELGDSICLYGEIFLFQLTLYLHHTLRDVLALLRVKEETKMIFHLEQSSS
jgi:hypothetical protein